MTTLHDRIVGDVRLALVILLGAVAMVLLIACANVANLVLVRGAARQNELAVRTALGAGRRGLVSYLLTENLVLPWPAGRPAWCVAAWGVDLLRWLAPPNLPRLDEVALRRSGVSVRARPGGPDDGAVRPRARRCACRACRWRARSDSAGTVDGGGGAGRAGLLVAEVGLALVLLLAAGLMLRSLAAQQRIDPGWRSEGITTFLLSLPAARYPADRVVPTFDQLDAELGRPARRRVGRSDLWPAARHQRERPQLHANGRPAPDPARCPSALYRVVDPEYFQTMAIPLLAGRAFQASDRDLAPRVAIVSRELADTYFPGEDPVGRSIRLNGPDAVQIVGVAANVRSQQLQADAAPELYVPHAQAGSRAITFVAQEHARDAAGAERGA